MQTGPKKKKKKKKKILHKPFMPFEMPLMLGTYVASTTKYVHVTKHYL
jgi:hypothetical protein